MRIYFAYFQQVQNFTGEGIFLRGKMVLCHQYYLLLIDAFCTNYQRDTSTLDVGRLNENGYTFIYSGSYSLANVERYCYDNFHQTSFSEIFREFGGQRGRKSL